MKFEAFLRQLGNNIKSARIERGLKQVDVHAGCGLTYRHYQNIEAGRVNVTVETLYRLSRFYGIEVRELLVENPPR